MKTAENFIYQAKEYLGINDLEDKQEVDKKDKIEEIEIESKLVSDRINSQDIDNLEIETKKNEHQSKSSTIFTILAMVSQLNKSDNK